MECNPHLKYALRVKRKLNGIVAQINQLESEYERLDKEYDKALNSLTKKELDALIETNKHFSCNR
jgi:hypothetical protein